MLNKTSSAMRPLVGPAQRRISSMAVHQRGAQTPATWSGKDLSLPDIWPTIAPPTGGKTQHGFTRIYWERAMLDLVESASADTQARPALARAAWSGDDLSPQDIWPALKAAPASWEGGDLQPQDIHPTMAKAVQRPKAKVTPPALNVASSTAWSGDDLSPQDIWPALKAAPASSWEGGDLQPQDIHPTMAKAVQRPKAKVAGARPALNVMASAEWSGDDLSPQDIWPSIQASPAADSKPHLHTTFTISLPLAAVRQQLRMSSHAMASDASGMYTPAPYEWGYDRVGRGYDVCRVGGDIAATSGGAIAAAMASDAPASYTPAMYEWGYDRVGRGYDVCKMGVTTLAGRGAAAAGSS